MRAAIYRGRGDIAVEDVPEPGAPGEDEVQLRVLRAAVCGTDSAEWDHGPVLAEPPVILGHEFMGVVESVGEGVSGFEVSDRVVSGAGVWCGVCSWCRESRTNLCESYFTLGLHAPGGLAELVNVPSKTLLHVPDDLSDAAAALAQPQAVAMHAVKRSGVQPGDSCVVLGIGGIGAFIVAAARSRGVEDLIAIDIDTERLHTAERLGASRTIDATDLDLETVLRGAAAPEGPRVVIEATGVPRAPAAAFEAVRRGGRVLLVGLQGPREIDLLSLTVREVEVTTTLAHVFAQDLAASLDVLRTTEIVDVVLEKEIPLDALVEEAIVPLAERRAKGKVVVDLTL